MQIIKFSVLDESHYPIEQSVFEKKSQQDLPYYSDPLNKEESSHYAVCPACDNPVQIIGLYKKNTHTEKPYAKHYANSIQSLAKYIQENYDYCPLRAKRTKHSEYAKKAQANALTMEIVRRLVNSFDKVIYFLESKTQLLISDRLARQMLEKYFANQGYLYYNASLINIPIKFAHAAGVARSLYGRVVRNEILKKALIEKVPSIRFDGNVLKGEGYVDVKFSFIHHEIHHEGKTMYETLVFSVHEKEKNGIRPITLYEQEIRLDHDYYKNLLNYSEEKLNEQQKIRKAKLLVIAKEVAEEFKFIF